MNKLLPNSTAETQKNMTHQYLLRDGNSYARVLAIGDKTDHAYLSQIISLSILVILIFIISSLNSTVSLRGRSFLGDYGSQIRPSLLLRKAHHLLHSLRTLLYLSFKIGKLETLEITQSQVITILAKSYCLILGSERSLWRTRPIAL